MTILEQLRKTQIAYRQQKDTAVVSFISFLISSIEMIGKNSGNRQTTDDEAIVYLKKLVSSMKEFDSVANSEEGKFQIEFMTSMIPAIATEEEIDTFLGTIEFTDIKTAMQKAREKFGQNVDMKVVSQKVKEKLSI